MSPYRCPPRRPSARLRARQLVRSALTLLAALILALGSSALALLGPATTAYAAGDLTVRVYNDLNRDGELQPGEAFVAPAGGGIPVAVYDGDNTLVALNTTTAGGTVTFTALPSSAAGTPYRVEAVASALGVISRFGTAPPPNTLVSFVELVDGAAVSVEVGLRLNGNFGGTAGRRTIVTRVWDDFDGNGIQDAGEPGIAGVTLRAVDTVTGDPVPGVPEVTSDADGYAVFDDTVPTSSLSLRVVGGAPAGYLLTRQNVNDNQFTPSDLRDSDAFLRGGAGPVEVVVPAALTGQNDDSIDIGYTQGAISGFVFRDRDPAKDGLFTAGVDEFLDGVEVQLFDLDDTLVRTQTTRTVAPGSAGFFEFGNLPLSGSPYRLVIPTTAFDDDGDILFGAASSPNPPGGDLGQVNGTAPSAIVGPSDDVQIAGISLTAANPGTSNVSTANLFGFYQGTIGDLVALDADRDGAVDPEDASLGIPGVLVFIDDGRAGGTAGNNLRETGELSATTDTSGLYRFDNVPLGPAYDVVLDRSNFDAGGVLEGLGSTNALSVTLTPSGRVLVRTSDPLGVAPDDADLSVDFGIRGADVGNVVWDDADGDGLQDVGETGVPSVTVRIFRATDPPAQVGAAQQTDATGAYTIPNLLAGSYFVQFDLAGAAGFYGSPLAPAGYAGVDPTNDALNENDIAFDGDLDAFHADRIYQSDVFSVAPGSDNPGVDAALYRPVALAGLAFFDEDGDALNAPDPADPGVGGLAVQVRHPGPDGVAGNADDLLFDGATTGADGAYSFDAADLIPPGQLRVEFLNPDPDSFAFVAPDAGTPPDSNDTTDSDVVGSADLGGRTFGFTDAAAVRASGQSYANVDGGYTGTTQIGGLAFVDGDADGLSTGLADAPLPAADVTLVYSFTLGAEDLALTSSTTTDATGVYTFTAVPSGTFSLAFTPPAGVPPFVPTFADEADNTNTDSDGPSPTDGLTDQELIGGAPERRDAGFYQYVQVEGRVFFDTDSDDLDSTTTPEPGLQQVTVRLLNLGTDSAFGGSGAAADQTITATTDLDGAYTITPAVELRPGNLIFEVQNPDGDNFAFVAQNVGADDTIDSDVSPANAQAAVTIASGETVADLDAGLAGARSVVADAFVDADGDGTNDDGAPLAGVTATLSFTAEVLPWLPSVALPERSGVTGATGVFTFSEVTSGAFSLGFTPPADAPPWQITFPDVGDPSPIDSDGDSAVDGLLGQTLSTAGDAPFDEARSQGYVKPASVSGEVWFDSDGDGARDDPGDAPMTGVTVDVVNLGPDGVLGGTDDITETVTTDATGAYTSSGALPPGQFVVRVVNPSAADFAFVARATPENGSDVDAQGLSAPFAVASGATATGVDAGLAGTASVGGTVFVDADGDGQSVGDDGLADATVALTYTVALPNLDTTITRTLSTGAAGSYSFAGLPGTGASGEYELRFTAPVTTPAWLPTFTDIGPDATDSDGDQSGLTLDASEPAPAFDQGYFQPVRVTARVFEDATLPLDNEWDAGEPGLSGATVELQYAGPLPEGEPQRPAAESAISGADGLVSFDAGLGLPPGEYRLVAADVPAGFSPTVGNTETVALDPLTSGGASLTEAAPVGTTNVFGYVQAVDVSGEVWFDNNDDGQRDPGDAPMTGVTVEVISLGPDGVLGGTDDISDTVTTDATGAYSTDGTPALPPGQLVVRVVNPSAVDFAFVARATPENGSDVDAQGVSETFAAASGAGVSGVDAGLSGTASVGGTVFVDADGDGQNAPDPADPGLPGATVALTATVALPSLDTTITRTATTGPDGAYSLGGLPGTGTGSYELRFTAPVTSPAWLETFVDVGDDATDSDGDQAGLALDASEPAPVFDQGYFQPVQVTARVFEDATLPLDNEWDAGEAGLGGATVELRYEGPLAAGEPQRPTDVSATSDASGLVDFAAIAPDLPPGDYQLVVTDRPPPPLAYVPTVGNTETVALGPLTSGGAALTEDAPVGTTNVFGYVQAVGVTGEVWFDADDGGARDPGDLPLAGFEVAAVTEGGAVAGTGTSDATGTYAIADLLPGTYVISVTNPSAANFTFVPGATPANGSDVDAQGVGAPFDLTSGVSDAVQDVGVTGAKSVSGVVFLDSDGDGRNAPDPADPGLPDATVELTYTVSATLDPYFGATPTFTRGVSTTAAPDEGVYAFGGLPGGRIDTLAFTAPATPPDLAPTFADVSGNGFDDDDSDGPLISGVDLDPTAASPLFDQGYFQTVAVSGTVWFDRDNDATRDADDPPLAGVTVEVIGLGPDGALGGADDITDTLTTDAAGAYSTDGAPALPPGKVVVRVLNPGADDFGFVLNGADSDLRSAEGAPATAARTDPVDVASGGSAAGVDAGLNGARAISGVVFEDANGDGLSVGDSGLPGASVALTHTVDLSVGGVSLTTTLTRTATTAADGAYSFAGLPGSGAGTFTVTFTAPDADPPWQATLQDVGADDEIDSDGDPATGEVTGSLTTPAASFDQGYFRGATVSGRVWFDSDGDGALDAGEPPLIGVTVELIEVGADGQLGGGDDGAPIVLTTDAETATAGQYLTASGAVRPGRYVARVTNPDTGSFAFRTSGADNDIRATDGATPPAQGWTEPFAVTSGADSTGHDAGLVGAGTIAGVVFVDEGADGQNAPDPADPPLPGATAALTLSVSLPALDATLTYSATTGASGTYSFAGLPAGTIAGLAFAAPAATPPWQATLANIGPEETDSDGPTIAGVAFAPGATPTAFDQGYFQDAVITARVFDEREAIDNTLQAGEPGIAGVEVGIDTDPAGSATTGATGLVTFTVRPGAYNVTSPTPPNFTASPTNTGSVALTATSGLALFADFGYYRPSGIAGTAWFDSDGDGRLDAGEPGMEAITVTLASGAGVPIPGAEGVTDATGSYTITEVGPSGIDGAPDAYRLCFSRTADFTFTLKSGLVVDDGNSYANPDGCTDTFQVLGSSSAITMADVGYRGLNSIGDLAWDDVDGDGIQDPTEDGLAGVVVTLAISTTDAINTSGPTLVMTSTTSTASAGLGPNYFVRGVPPASGFRVLAVAPPAGYVPTLTNVVSATEETDSDAVGDSFGPVTGDVEVVDFGFSAVTTIGDLVWLDLNGNGVYDAASESGAPGVVVRLIGATGEISRTTTGIGAQAGRYSFDEVAPGTYSLRFDAPAGYAFTNDGAGAIATDGDNDARSDGTTAPFTVTGGQQLLSVDAGLRGVSSISGLVWIDLNRNSVRDPSETERVAGVEVTLTVTPTLTPGRLLTLSATTAEDGTYSFADLPEGQARVSFAQPAGLFAVAQNVGPEANDSDGPVATVVLSPGSQVRNLDMGYRRQGLFVYLPLVQGRPAAPELSGSFTVTPASPQAYSPAQVTVTVTNTGDAPASNFWVDLYINPSQTPEVNDRWNDICGTAATPCQGIAWFYTGTLEPGQSVTLVSTATSETSPVGYERGASIWPGYFVNGTSRLFVLIDSWNRDESGEARAPDGALQERDESNNLIQQGITVTPGSPPGPERAVPGAALPERSTLRR